MGVFKSYYFINRCILKFSSHISRTINISHESVSNHGFATSKIQVVMRPNYVSKYELD